MSASVPVDAVIVAYRSEERLESCVAALRTCRAVRRIVVVDNASPDASAKIGARLGCEVVCTTANLGFGTGQNRGVDTCDAPYVLMVNPDALVDERAVEAGREFLEAHPNVALVQGVIRRARDGTEERWQGAAPGVRDLVARLLRLRERLGERRLQRLAGVTGARYYAARELAMPKEVAFIAAVAPLIRRAAFDDVGGFDERIFLYAEDVDLCFRLRARGWRLVALPVEWAGHVGGASSEGTASIRERAFWEGHRRVVRAHWSRPRRWVGLVITGVGATVARRRAA